MVLKSILGCFLDAFLTFFLIRRGNVKCGFDSLFIVYKAHGHVEQIVKIFKKNHDKMEVPFGSLRDTNLGSILEAFGVPLGSLGASN